jgi:hypothetical protein
LKAGESPTILSLLCYRLISYSGLGSDLIVARVIVARVIVARAHWSIVSPESPVDHCPSRYPC